MYDLGCMLVESRPFAVLDGLSGLYGLKYDSATACRLPLYLCSYKLVGSAIATVVTSAASLLFSTDNPWFHGAHRSTYRCSYVSAFSAAAWSRSDYYSYSDSSVTVQWTSESESAAAGLVCLAPVPDLIALCFTSSRPGTMVYSSAADPLRFYP